MTQLEDLNVDRVDKAVYQNCTEWWDSKAMMIQPGMI